TLASPADTQVVITPRGIATCTGWRTGCTTGAGRHHVVITLEGSQHRDLTGAHLEEVWSSSPLEGSQLATVPTPGLLRRDTSSSPLEGSQRWPYEHPQTDQPGVVITPRGI